MYVAEFKTADEVNKFVETVVLSDQSPVQHNGENFIVFYEAKKDGYQDHFIARMKEGLARNLFHEEVRKVALDAEVDEYKEIGTNNNSFDDVKKRQKEADENIKIFKAKIKGLDAWTNKK